MTRHKLALSACVSTLALAMALPAGAWAAETDVEELVVTARKRDEALIDVPFSVAAQTEAVMRNRGVTNVEELSRTVASFSVQNLGPGQSQVAIRGISAGQIVRDQPGVKEQVGVYLDESVISLSLFTPDLDLFDLNRVEVLRGPQGTLYGSGSLSGTVRYITNQPTTAGFEGVVEATAAKVQGGDVGYSLKGAVNMPLNEQMALRVTAYNEQFAGFIDAVQPDGSVEKDVNDGWRRGVRAALLIKPSENFEITPRVLYQKIDVDGFNRVDVYNILGNQFTTTRPRVQLGGLKQYTQLKEKFEDEFFLADLTLQYDFDGVRLTSISSFTDRDVLVLRDATALTGSITGGSIGLPEAVYTIDAPLYDTTDVKTITQEVRLSSTGDGPLQWVAGAFYSDIDRDYAQDLRVVGFSAATGIPTASDRAPTDSLYYSVVPYKQRQYALFGEATYAVTERLDVTAGLRWSDYKETRTLTFDGIFADKTIEVPGKTKADAWAPRVIVAYEATDDITLNAQVSKGFRLGGINDPLNRPLCTPADFATFNSLSQPSFKNETVWNYEAGLKARLGGGAGQFTLAGFYADINNLQATIDAGSCSSRIIANVESAKSVGFDAEFSYRLTENFDVAATASYNDAELTSSLLDAAGQPIQGLRDGNRLPTVPKFQASFSVGYEREMSNGGSVFSNLTLQHVGKRYTQISDQENNPRSVPLFPNVGGGTATSLIFPLELPSYEIVNLRVGVRGEGWEAAAFVNNLGDERAKLSIDRERGLRARYGFITNAPRTYGATFRKEF
ncbi:TonB-dependent receptor [Phenylobacterium kunshanense]|uniref:TonB-dependent receptor n=1 Tax=Phenylobacterium kunshanense TaxID=1445034 RepID=A0A328BIW5_9CAUL|nr:TonB-dependent receptor [Phenylobacterium kunshanense]RAK67422.1 TonB-dependent receptor [Phenylobacterium kunshanense]